MKPTFRNRCSPFAAGVPRRLLLAGLGLACLWGAKGEDESFDLFPLSRPWKDVRIPRYNENDVLTSMMHTESLTRRDQKELELEGLTVVMFQQPRKMSLRLKTKEGLYDVASSLLRTHATTFIEHPQFEMKGDRMKFDTATQKGTLEGNVEMLIYNVPVAVKAPAVPQSGNPAEERERKSSPPPRESDRPTELAQVEPNRHSGSEP